MVTPSWVVIIDTDNMSTEFEKAVAGHMCVVLQVDVDLACEETFYVTDGESGKVRIVLSRVYLVPFWGRSGCSLVCLARVNVLGAIIGAEVVRLQYTRGERRE